jgi:hypothetical protein
MSADSEFETWFPRGDRVGPAGVPVQYRARRGRGPDMNRSTDAPRTSDSRPDWPPAGPPAIPTITRRSRD